jgi:hypothetical protein
MTSQTSMHVANSTYTLVLNMPKTSLIALHYEKECADSVLIRLQEPQLTSSRCFDVSTPFRL